MESPQSPAPPPPPGPESPAAYGGPVPPGGWQQPIPQHQAWDGRPLASWGSRVGGAAHRLADPARPGRRAHDHRGGRRDGSDTGAVVTGILGGLAYLVVLFVYAPVLMAREGEHNGRPGASRSSASAWCATTGSTSELRLGRPARDRRQGAAGLGRVIDHSSRSRGCWTTSGRSGTTRTAACTTWSSRPTSSGSRAVRPPRGARARRRRSRSSRRGRGPTPTITIGTPRKSEMNSR